MPAIISDQFRIMNAETFVKSLVSIGSTANKYYTFIGQPNSLNPEAGGDASWQVSPPSPLDDFVYESKIKDTIITLKKILTSDVSRVIRKEQWVEGTTYEMYRNDYNAYNISPITNSTTLYDANYYVINDFFRVYICLNNGATPENPKGNPSLDQPTFVGLEASPAGTSGDGYIWKYLYTIKPIEFVKFDSVNFIPVPENWGSSTESSSRDSCSQESDVIKNNAIDGKIEVVSIRNRGSEYTPSTTYNNIPILGDGTGGKVTIVTNSFGEVSEIIVTDGGMGYTAGIIKFEPGAPGIPSDLSLGAVNNSAQFDVIIPPKGGHGYDIYRELGAYRVLVYSRYETDQDNPDAIVGNDFATVGIIKNPIINTNIDTSYVSGLKSLKLKTTSTNTVYPVDREIKQTISTGTTAIGFVASWDNITGVLKYYQPVGLAKSEVNYVINDFSSTVGVGGTTLIECEFTPSTDRLLIDTSFNENLTTINNKIYQLGTTFTSGISSSEYVKGSGELLYIDTRQAIPRSVSQKEDIKIILEF
jgi:hypothetical protein